MQVDFTVLLAHARGNLAEDATVSRSCPDQQLLMLIQTGGIEQRVSQVIDDTIRSGLPHVFAILLAWVAA